VLFGINKLNHIHQFGLGCQGLQSVEKVKVAMVAMMLRRGAARPAPAFYLYAPHCMLLSRVSCFALHSMPSFIFIFFSEILVDVVDVVLEGSGIDEKFLGITLFALVPNTTEFMNAISFALNGNIALRYGPFIFCSVGVTDGV
jgi:hypothetical protein